MKHNESLIKYLGMNGPSKCGEFVTVDGPDAEAINAFLAHSESSNEVEKYISIFDDAYKVLTEFLPGAQKQLDDEVNLILGLESNPFNLYKVTLELTQDALPLECETILITGLSFSEKKSFKKEKLEGISYLAFDKKGALLTNCSPEKPFYTKLKSLVDFIEECNNNSKKFVESCTNEISFSKANSKEVSLSKDTKTTVIDPKKSKESSSSQLVINKKIAAVGLAAFVAVGSTAFAIGNKKLKTAEADMLNEVKNAEAQVSAFSTLVSEISKNPDAGALAEHLTKIQALLKEYNIAYDTESKSLIPTTQGDSATASNK